MSNLRVREGALEVTGGALTYTAAGYGVPVLVIGSAAFYRRTFSSQLGSTYRLGFCDLRHFAPSAADFDPADVTFDLYADDIDRLRLAIGFDRCVVVGHSKHGNIAIEYARRFPKQVLGVVLVGSPPCSGAEVLTARIAFWEAQASEHRKAVYERNRKRLDEKSLAGLSARQAVVVQYVADGPKYWFDPEFDASPLWEDVFVNAPMLGQLHELFFDLDPRWDAGDLKTPILVVMGRYDFAVPHRLWDGVRASQTELKFILLERSGHTPQLEEPEQFDRAFTSWVSEIG